jgi:hypothetical protein
MVADTKLGYNTAHRWLRLDRGHASTHRCVDCGERARDWSYAYERATQRHFDASCQPSAPYSLNPNDYDPRCKRCHANYDMRHRKQTTHPEAEVSGR